jgi:predicted ATPase
VIERICVHNYRCLSNFDLRLDGIPSALLIGKNGSGKSAVRDALRLLQQVARGTNRVQELVSPSDLAWGNRDTPARFEITVRLREGVFDYALAFEPPGNSRELRVLEEQLSVDQQKIYGRESAQVTLSAGQDGAPVVFGIDWQLVALPIVEHSAMSAKINGFRSWMRRMLILAPETALMSGVSHGETLEPDLELRKFGEWFSGLMAYAPRAYGVIESYLKEVLPQFQDIQNPPYGPETRSLRIGFREGDQSHQIPFQHLSDGEKCILASALVLAAIEVHGAVFCFWDEPDRHLALSEVGHFVMALRRAFQGGNQLIVTSHHPETINKFSDENTFCLYRQSWLEPAQIQPVSRMQRSGDLVTSLLIDGLEP